MSNEAGGGGSRRKLRPLKDLRLARNLARKVKRSDAMVTQKDLSRLISVISQSQDQGTYNRKDKKAVAKLIRAIDNKYGSSGPSTSKEYRNLSKLSGVKKRNAFSDFYGGALKPEPKDKMDIHYDPKGKRKAAAQAAARATRKGKGRNSNGGPYTQRGMAYYGLGKFPGVDVRDARNIVRGDNNRLIRELLNEMKGVRSGMDYDIRKGDAQYNRAKGDLEYIFGEAGDYINAQNSKIAGQFDKTGNVLQDLYAQLQSRQGSITNDARQRMLAEQSRLGIQKAGTGRFEEDAANMQALAAQQQANNMANNQTAKNSSQEIGQLLASMTAAEKTSNLGKAQNARDDFASQTRQQGRTQLNEILGDIRGIRKDTPNQVQQLFLQMEQNAYQRWAESQQADFNNQLAANNFNLDVSRLNSDNLWQKAKLRQEARRQAALRRNQQRQANRDSNRLDSDLISIMNPWD